MKKFIAIAIVLAIASAANIGGAASAPIVAAHHRDQNIRLADPFFAEEALAGQVALHHGRPAQPLAQPVGEQRQVFLILRPEIPAYVRRRNL